MKDGFSMTIDPELTKLAELARLAAQAPEMDVALEKAFALARIEARQRNAFIYPHRAFPRQVFEELAREALLAAPPGDAGALVRAIAPLMSLRQSDYDTDIRFSAWISTGENGTVEFGLFSDIEGRADLQLRWMGDRWRTFWRDDDAWHEEDPEDSDLAALLTRCLDWDHFNAYVFDETGRNRWTSSNE